MYCFNNKLNLLVLLYFFLYGSEIQQCCHFSIKFNWEHYEKNILKVCFSEITKTCESKHGCYGLLCNIPVFLI